MIIDATILAFAFAVWCVATFGYWLVVTWVASTEPARRALLVLYLTTLATEEPLSAALAILVAFLALKAWRPKSKAQLAAERLERLVIARRAVKAAASSLPVAPAGGA